MPFRARVALFALLAVVVTACTGGDDESTIVAEQPGGAMGEVSGTTAAPLGVSTTTGATRPEQGKPVVVVPDGPPPSTLEVTDIYEGTEAQAHTGDTVEVVYVGVNYSDGKEFDSNWAGEVFSFTLGAGDVIQGWDEGLVGMKRGGRRQLVIPPDKAYGDQGAGGVIAPGATLVFVVDLVMVTPPG